MIRILQENFVSVTVVNGNGVEEQPDEVYISPVHVTNINHILSSPESPYNSILKIQLNNNICVVLVGSRDKIRDTRSHVIRRCDGT